jgi:hypothetical protein
LILGIGSIVVAATAVISLGLGYLHLFVRGDDGYYSTGREALTTKSHALVVDDIDLGGDRAGVGVDDLGAKVRFKVDGSNASSIFVGIAPRDDAEAFLNGTSHAVVEDFNDGEAQVQEQPGNAPLERPATSDIWVASDEGTGARSVEWSPRPGRWAAVAMNADASPGVSVNASTGVRIAWLGWVALGFLATAAIAAAITRIILRELRDAR